jgi:hypothetical protein
MFRALSLGHVPFHGLYHFGHRVGKNSYSDMPSSAWRVGPCSWGTREMNWPGIAASSDSWVIAASAVRASATPVSIITWSARVSRRMRRRRWGGFRASRGRSSRRRGSHGVSVLIYLLIDSLFESRSMHELIDIIRRAISGTPLQLAYIRLPVCDQTSST